MGNQHIAKLVEIYNSRAAALVNVLSGRYNSAAFETGQLVRIIGDEDGIFVDPLFAVGDFVIFPPNSDEVGAEKFLLCEIIPIPATRLDPPDADYKEIAEYDTALQAINGLIKTLVDDALNAIAENEAEAEMDRQIAEAEAAMGL